MATNGCEGFECLAGGGSGKLPARSAAAAGIGGCPVDATNDTCCTAAASEAGAVPVSVAMAAAAGTALAANQAWRHQAAALDCWRYPDAVLKLGS
jgi:hypothetical protein